MKNKMEAYIDSFEVITVLLQKEIGYQPREFYIIDDNLKTYELEEIEHHEEYDFFKYTLRMLPNIKLNKDYKIMDSLGNSAPLYSGSVVRCKEFDEKFRYDGPLGFEYSPMATTFRIWAPVAKEIVIEIYQNGKTKKKVLKPTEKGVWEITIPGNLDGAGYLYYGRSNGRKFESFLDPYAISTSANSKYNYVIDLKKLYQMKYPIPEFSGKYTDAIIYEADVRDFTNVIKSEEKGTYLGMLVNEPTRFGPTGLEYIKSLGITHLQLLPVFDFEGVDDLKKDLKYNWGYNPRQYLVPSGWYSKDPNNPYSRINELLELIDNCHKNGIRVNFDVVFNHVCNAKTFAADKITPGYFYRLEADGRLSNASGCGNVIATERYMASKFLVDSLIIYRKLYKVTGFRFDLMGLLDINTLNRAKKELDRIDKTIMLYGEGWNMHNPLPDYQRPHMFNHHKIPAYAFFNDRFRDYIRGSQWTKNPGFAFDREKNIYDLNNLLKGSCCDYFKFDEPTQSLNYVECHDNFTFYDYAKTILQLPDEKIIPAGLLALEIILVSQGIPFIHAGEEFFRTKQGVENSYKSKAVNNIDYKRRDKYIKYINAIKDLISIRKEYKELRLSKRVDIENKVHILDGLTHPQTSGVLIEGDTYELIILVKGSKSRLEIDLPGKLIFEPMGKTDIENKKVTLTDIGVYIIRKEKKHVTGW